MEPRSGGNVGSGEQGTRRRLIEAAGAVFSEKGYDRATARQICDLARANYAAVNYHFGGKKELYLEVLREAHRRLINVGAIAAAAAAEGVGSVEERLEKVFLDLLHTLLDQSHEGWTTRVIMREMAAPTRALEDLVELQILPASRLFRAVIGQVMNLPVDHEAVVRGAVSTIGQLIFIFQNRRTLEQMYPGLELRGKGMEAMARHIRVFSVAGLRAAAKDAGEGERP